MPDYQPIPLLLLHGFPLDARMWRHTVARFANERTVIAPDVADLVDDSAERPSMETMARAAGKALDREAPDAQAVVVGLSMGGYAAMEFARAFPDRLAGLVLCDTRCVADTEEARRNRDAMVQAVREHGVPEGTRSLVEKLLSPSARPEVAEEVRAMVEDAQPEVILACIRALRDRRDNCATLESVRVPALVVRGADDALAPGDVTEQMAHLLKSARMVEIPNAGHVPPMEAPDAFNAALEGFLRENDL
jgi:pimeloyl-ACP methyl ester carboxylesterase